MHSNVCVEATEAHEKSKWKATFYNKYNNHISHNGNGGKTRYFSHTGKDLKIEMIYFSTYSIAISTLCIHQSQKSFSIMIYELSTTLAFNALKRHRWKVGKHAEGRTRYDATMATVVCI